jgi:hypothetical protein
MEKTQFTKWFDEQVGGRWPKWQTSTLVISDWFSAFGGFDGTILNEAVRRHRVYDDPSSPSTRRLLEIIAQIRPRKRPVEKEPLGEVLTAEQFWQKVRTTFSKEQRIELMVSLAKFHPKPWEKDEQAYRWAVDEGLVRAEKN